jgi:carboxyl-terminal processing protease
MRRPRSFVATCAFATVLFLFLCCCVGFHSAAGAQDRAPAFQAESHWDKTGVDLAKLFDAVVETVDQKFFDEALLKQLNWRARAKALRPSVLSAATPEDAVRQINALLAELKTSHTALLTPDDYFYYTVLDVVGVGTEGTELITRRFWGSGPYYPGTGAFTQQIDGRHFVDGVLEGSPADRAGLKYGDEILAIDGLPYSPIAVFRGKTGTTVELTFRRHSNAEPQRLQIPVVAISPTRAFSQAMLASTRVIERNGSQIGYVHIWSSNESNSFKTALAKFEVSNMIQDRLARMGIRSVPNSREALINAIGELPKPLDFLIVDMRGRVGGNIAVANQYLQALDQQNPYWGNWRTIGRTRDQLGSTRPSFRGRSALLIDDHTRSVAEIVAHGYKRSAFGPVIGTPSAGAVTSGALYVMPGDLLLYVAVAGHEFDNGYRLEGVGITPDIRVERPLPYAAGADPVLDAAVELLASQAPK